ncbi:MAG: VapC toxin family PIN domain ribonuclease [Proteobacteria bacterium ST_bin14]|nr:MAG: VapC toxin family PIN domain ribonuclease [Proteobacteria bacterium ST_bin14]
MAIYAMAERHSALNDKLANCYPGDVAISAISFAEIAVGTFVGKPPSPEVLNGFISVIPILPFDSTAARQYARLPFKRARFDRLLAAHALSLGAVVITNNEADFADVPGLLVENWTL